MPRQQYGTRGLKVTVVIWQEEDGTQGIRAYAASGERPATHATAADFKKELLDAGIEEHTIIVQTLAVK